MLKPFRVIEQIIDRATGTWNNFMPGMPTTIEGLSYALTGLLIGWGAYALLRALLTLPFTAKPQARFKK